MNKSMKALILINTVVITLYCIIRHIVKKNKHYVTANLNNFIKYRYY